MFGYKGFIRTVGALGSAAVMVMVFMAAILPRLTVSDINASGLRIMALGFGGLLLFVGTLVFLHKTHGSLRFERTVLTVSVVASTVMEMIALRYLDFFVTRVLPLMAVVIGCVVVAVLWGLIFGLLRKDGSATGWRQTFASFVGGTPNKGAGTTGNRHTATNVRAA